MARIPLLFNDKAGAFSGSPDAEAYRDAAKEAGIEIEALGTQSEDEMKQHLRRLVKEDAPVVIVCGGDGTVHGAVQELAHAPKTALAIVPQGTFNNFATALRLPLDLIAALRVVAEGHTRQVDLGLLRQDGCESYFTESVGVGIFADGLALYGRGANKNVLRALRASLRLALSLHPKRVELTIDGKRRVERLLMCEIANTFRIAQGVALAPGARLTDGKLDVVMVRPMSWPEMWRYYRAFRAQTHRNLPRVKTVEAEKIEIRASRRHLNIHCDDKFVGTSPATIEIQPGALRVMVEQL